MNELVDWYGKSDDLSIVYDAGIQKSQMLQDDISSLGENLPAIIYPNNDNIRDITDVTWDEKVKKADKIDYMMAVSSGTISGFIDIFYVGEFSLECANKWGEDEVNKFVKKIAELQGYKGNNLSDAITHLEKNFGLAADSVTSNFGGGLQHHLRDFSHHFSIGGLLCSLFTQFTGKVIGTDTLGALHVVEVTDKTFIGNNFEEKVLFGTVNWFMHMASDMAGSNATAGKGTGIPGPIVSLIKELSVLPCFKDKKIGENELHIWISKLFNGTLLAKRDENGKIIETIKFDLRTEIGILHEVGRQFVPVLINECLVRGLYFIRRFYMFMKENKIHSITDFQNIDAADLLPFNNRIIKRMITIASGTFTIIDAEDAAVRAAIKSKGINPSFFVNFAVRINIAGVGRFIIACKADGKFITEDILKAKEKRDKIEKEYEKFIYDQIAPLSLNFEQMRVLNSIKRLMVEDDITITKNEKEKNLKTLWKEEWEKCIYKELSLVSDTTSQFFLSETEVVKYIKSTEGGSWQFLIAMEVMLFTPYYSLVDCKDKKKEFKKLKYKSKYLTSRFINLQSKISKGDFSTLQKAYKGFIRTITGSNKSIIIGVAGTTVTIAATGGFALIYAPAIATAIVGGNTGLSGAALVSYSLAVIGGGSLAAGGLGMAGGTAIIAGGGALIGLLGGTGVSAATTMNLLADDGYILKECCKLLSFCKEVLIKKYEDISTVNQIQLKIESKLSNIQKQIETFAKTERNEKDENKKKEMKIKLKIAKKSIKYLKHTVEALNKMLKNKNIDTTHELPNV